MAKPYLAPDAAPGLPRAPTVLEVTDLLRVVVPALIEEPLLYEAAGRSGAIVLLILPEIGRARRLPLVLPIPRPAPAARVHGAAGRSRVATNPGAVVGHGRCLRPYAGTAVRGEVGLSVAAVNGYGPPADSFAKILRHQGGKRCP
jgi:hypothetical protein